MKHVLILILIFCISTCTFSQIHTYLYDYKNIDNSRDSSICDFNTSDRNNQPINIKNNYKDIIWKLDSAYYFNGSGSDWSLNFRSKTLMFDEFGNLALGIAHFWNSVNEIWIKKDTIIKNYYDAINVKDLTRIAWNSNTNNWSDTIFNFNYYSNGKIKMSFSKIWNYETNEFNYGEHNSYTYNINENLIERIYQKWNFETNNWENILKFVFNYDSNNRIICAMDSSWNDISNEWTIDSQTIYYYDVYGFLINELNQNWITSTNNWENVYQKTYTNDNEGNIIHMKREVWNILNEWENYLQTFYNYDINGNITLEQTQNWLGETNEWINSNQVKYFWDENVNLIQRLVQNWNTETNDWENNYQVIIVFDVNGNNIETRNQIWNNSLNNWINNSKNIYYYSEFEISNISGINDNYIKIYPNPATKKIMIESEQLIEKVYIYSISGQLFKTVSQDNYHLLEIDINDLPIGIYIINIIINKVNYTEKIIKEY